MKTTKIILFILILINISYSQTNPGKFFNLPEGYNIQTPNTSNLGSYGDYSVNLYTGSPDITVSLFDIKDKGIPLNILLKYDASGVRVNSVPTWVGQNWSLISGGVIQRSVKGMSADEFDATNGINDKNVLFPLYNNWDSFGPSEWDYRFWPWWNQGYKYSNNRAYLNSSNWNTNSGFENIFVNHAYTASYDPNWYSYWFSYSVSGSHLKKYKPDLEPDIFTFNFMGHSGNFFLGQDGQWKVASSSNLKIVCDFATDLIDPIPPVTSSNPIFLTNQYVHQFGVPREYPKKFPKVIGKIKIIDDEGNQFFFGNDATEITFPDFFDQHDKPVISSAWYLKLVKDKFDNIIYEFEYEKGPYIGQFYLSLSKLLLNNHTNSMSQVDSGILNTPLGYTGEDPNDSYQTAGLKGDGQMMLPVYLKKIKTKSGLEVDLNSSISNSMKFKSTDNNIFRPDRLFGKLTYSMYDLSTGNYLYSLGTPYYNNCNFYFYQRLTDFQTLNPDWNQVYNEPLALLKWKKLDNITIKDHNNLTLKVVDFSYINEPDKRLFLTGIDIDDKRYEFEYNNPELLPNFMSNTYDHLGYYKGSPFYFPNNMKDKNFWTQLKNNRNTNSATVKYGSLKKIIYPTGGYTEFEFEPHKYSKEVSQNGVLTSLAVEGIIGGLRVKKITNNDGNQNNYIKEYRYANTINSSQSSGNLLYRPKYFFENIDIQNISPIHRYLSYLNIGNVLPMSNIFSTPIEYSSVIEKQSYYSQSTGLISDNGYVQYKFSSYIDNPDSPPSGIRVPSTLLLMPRNDKGNKRGKLLEKLVYDKNNILKEKFFNSYNFNDVTNHPKVRAINQIIISVPGETNPENNRIMSAYEIPYVDVHLIQSRKTNYSSTGELIEVKNYEYKYYPDLNLASTNFGDSFNIACYTDLTDSRIKEEFGYPLSISLDPIQNSMYNSRILPVFNNKKSKIEGLNYLDSSINQVLMESKVDYRNINVNSINVMIPDKVLSRKGSNNFETEFTYDLYDNEGNLIQITNKIGIPTSIIWGYNRTQLIAKIENATYAEVQAYVTNLQNISNTGTEANLISALNSLRTALPNALITTYTHKPLIGISTVTDPKGDKQTYHYDSFNRLQFVKDAQGNILSENEYHYKN